ncbi:MAG: glycosyltransferase family 9 protein, partial [Candidatus Adiutrix sp.]|nr:glycosyltransferase family 9 protein [Candidatus Adiutrix sp.]
EVRDFLATLPALGFIKAHSKAQVGVVVTPQMAELAFRHRGIDEVFTLDPARGNRHLRQVARAIAQKDYRTAIIFDGRLRSLLTAAVAGIRNRLGARGLKPLSPLPFLYSHEVNIMDALWFLESQAYRAQKIAAALLDISPGVPLRPPPPAADPASAARADKLLGELSSAGPRIGLSLQGGQPEKSWPLPHFAALCRKLWRAFKAALFVVGTESDSSLAHSLAGAAEVPVANFCGRTNLTDVIALAAASNLFITEVTGVSHLAALTETPVISLFTWSNPVLWSPQTPHTRVLAYEWALKRFGLKPSDGPWLRPWLTAPIITPDLVFQEARVMLEAGA